MWNSLFTVAYMPEFSPELKNFITLHVAISSESEDTKQYHCDAIYTALEEQEEVQQKQLFVEDSAILLTLKKQCVDYVEF